MTPNASKQGKFGGLGAIFLFIFLPCMWGLGLQKKSPRKGNLKVEICAPIPFPKLSFYNPPGATLVAERALRA